MIFTGKVINIKTMVSQVPIPLNNQIEGIKVNTNNVDQNGVFFKISMISFISFKLYKYRKLDF